MSCRIRSEAGHSDAESNQAGQ